MSEIRMYKLHDHLYIRNHTKHIDSSKMLAALQSINTTLMLNVALINDDELSAACRTVGMDYRHVPLNDSGKKTDFGNVCRLGKEVAKIMEYGTVVINCDSGWNRSALVAVLALMRTFPGRPAEDIIREARSVRGQNLLKNEDFEAFLVSPRALEIFDE